MSIRSGEGKRNDPGIIGASEYCECAPLPPQLAHAMANRVRRTGGRWICGECGKPSNIDASIAELLHEVKRLPRGAALGYWSGYLDGSLRLLLDLLEQHRRNDEMGDVDPALNWRLDDQRARVLLILNACPVGGAPADEFESGG